MNVTESWDESLNIEFYPGQHLAKERQDQGLTQEYVAGKLHLRVKMVELLEEDAYSELPQPVFVQGYLRAYAKLLNLDPSPILSSYSKKRGPENTNERILRQKRKEPNFIELHLRYVIAAAVTLVLLLFYFWWSHTPSVKVKKPLVTVQAQENIQTNNQDLGLTDLSKMDTTNVTSLPKSKSKPKPKMESKD